MRPRSSGFSDHTPGRCVTVHADPEPGEVFLRVRGANLPDEVIALYDVLARMMSLALQYGAPLAKVGAMLEGVQASPAGPVQGDDRIRFCRSLPDLIGRYLLAEAKREAARMEESA